MPHVLIKLVTGRSPEVKARIAAAVTQALIETAGCDDAAVSVSMQDIAAADWTDGVYRPDIAGHPELLIKPPGYTPG